jgi:hypothetical protein
VVELCVPPVATAEETAPPEPDVAAQKALAPPPLSPSRRDEVDAVRALLEVTIEFVER